MQKKDARSTYIKKIALEKFHSLPSAIQPNYQLINHNQISIRQRIYQIIKRIRDRNGSQVKKLSDLGQRQLIHM
jgi:hypothetical protein